VNELRFYYRIKDGQLDAVRKLWRVNVAANLGNSTPFESFGASTPRQTWATRRRSTTLARRRRGKLGQLDAVRKLWRLDVAATLGNSTSQSWATRQSRHQHRVDCFFF
jgi:hypothetical protein